MNQNNNPNQQQPFTPPVRLRSNSKSKFWTFCFALIPGAGQMYHGLMKKGVFLMVLFCAIISISMSLYIPALIFIAPVVWFYAFFDTINRMNYSRDELAAVKDDFLFNGSLDGNAKINELLKSRHIFFGWSAIVLGGYALMMTILNNNFMYMYNIPYEIMDFFRRTIPSMIIPVVCVLIGIKLIKGSKKNIGTILVQEENEND